MKTPVTGGAGRRSSAFVDKASELAEATESLGAPYERPGFLHALAVVGREDRSDRSVARGCCPEPPAASPPSLGQLSTSP
jgi:hypothetical protein